MQFTSIDIGHATYPLSILSHDGIHSLVSFQLCIFLLYFK